MSGKNWESSSLILICLAAQPQPFSVRFAAFLLPSPSSGPLRINWYFFCSLSHSAGWDRELALPKDLVGQVREISQLLKSWEGRNFEGQDPVRQNFSDSSDLGWGALDITSGAQLEEFWRTEKGLHINVKELKAAISAVKSLGKPGEKVLLSIDNQVAYSYLRKKSG